MEIEIGKKQNSEWGIQEDAIFGENVLVNLNIDEIFYIIKRKSNVNTLFKNI